MWIATRSVTTTTTTTTIGIFLLVAGVIVGRVVAVERSSFVVVRTTRINNRVAPVDITHTLEDRQHLLWDGTRNTISTKTWDHQWALSFSSFIDDSNIVIQDNHENKYVDATEHKELPLSPPPPSSVGSWLVLMISRLRDKIERILESIMGLLRPLLQDRIRDRSKWFLRRRSTNITTTKKENHPEVHPLPPLEEPQDAVHTAIDSHDRDILQEEASNNKDPSPPPPPPSDRSAYAASHIDLSGSWKPVVTPQFQRDYDDFLKNCSQPYLLRQVMIRGIQYQVEHVQQLQRGRELDIVSTNPAGRWHRTLVASDDTGIDSPFNVTIVDPDGDPIQVEAWWEQHGTRHRSWLRGKPNLYGGFIETIRYLQQQEQNDDVVDAANKNSPPPTFMICESTFHPHPQAPPFKNFQPGRVVWKYQRVV